MKQIVLGTAGHIDHGKTTLIKALTGIETDRLKEEKARGITIELGFAYLDLPSGLRLGIVDVPGHEKFVKNMVAGAAGIDLVALVIAADEGVMPQTREHLEICSLLEVRQGLVVLTKVDMVDEEWLDLVSEDIAEFLTGTFLEGAPIVPVSGVTGRGIPELIDLLDQMTTDLDERPSTGPFRLPVDRVFTMRGFGTVITGTSIDGQVEVGGEVVIYPQQQPGRVRGLQVHNQDVTTARRGQRTAMNLQGVEKTEIKRGDVVAEPGSLQPSLWLDIEAAALPSMARPLKQRAPIRFHVGTAEVLGRILFLDRDELKAGETALCQVRLEAPVAAMAMDRYVMRSYSPVHTIAGGVIVHPHPKRHKRFRPEITADLTTLRSGTPEEKILVHARLATTQGLAPAHLPRLTGMPAKELDGIIKELLSKQKLIRFDPETGRMISAEIWQQLLDESQKLLADFHQAQPHKPGMSREEFRRRLLGDPNPKLFNRLLKKLTDDNLAVAEKELLRLPQHKVTLAEDEEQLRNLLLQAYQQGGNTPPTFKELTEKRDPNQVRKVLGVLSEEGQLVKINQDLYYHQQALQNIKDQLIAFLQQNERISTPQFKDITGLTRKFLIPLLEHFDTTQLTMRIGDERVLRKK